MFVESKGSEHHISDFHNESALLIKSLYDMKNVSFILALLLISEFANSQYQEFTTYSNGLIYDTTTMNKLGDIVDSLNLKFKTCDLAASYYSYPQGMAHVVKVTSKTAKSAIKHGMSFMEFKDKFPGKILAENFWVTKSFFTDYEGKQKIEYSGLPSGLGNEHTIRLKNNTKNDITSGWVMSTDGELAFYLESLGKTALPFDYGRLVQYVDCMIDTTTQIYLANASSKIYPLVDEGSDANRFIEWAKKYPEEPDFPSYESENYQELASKYDEQYKNWNENRLHALDSKIDKSHYYKSLLMNARDEALTNANSDSNLEFYVARYLSKEDALQMKRSRKVMGNCSQDLSPRYHAMEISTLAAETASWDVFLRAHLDMMNDKFERMSDGNYAWEGRKTYLREIEELDINAIDLLLGTCLSVGNLSDNHYQGSIRRVGRALSDAQNKEALEVQLLLMIEDDQLDFYNRLLMAYLFDNYNYNLSDKKIMKRNETKLKKSIETWPNHMKAVWGNK
jgi:hypothetical protein